MSQKYRWVFWLCAFLTIAVLLRAPFLLQNVIDWDESIYATVAKAWLNGKIPYVDVWDHKPLGTYIMFAVAMIFAGKNILALRLLGLICVTVTSFFLFLSARCISAGRRMPGIIAGTLYLLYLLCDNGLATNTEILYLPFSTAAFYLLFRQIERSQKPFVASDKSYFFMGLLLGVAFQIKYVAIYEGLAFLGAQLVFWFTQAGVSVESSKKLLRVMITGASGFIIPTLIIVSAYFLSGHWPQYTYANFTANSLYLIDKPFDAQFLQSRLIWFYSTNRLLVQAAGLAVICMIFPGLRNLCFRNKPVSATLLLWSVAVLAGISFSLLRYYDHYYIPLLVPFSLLAGLGVAGLARRAGVRAPMLIIALLFLLLPFLANNLGEQYHFYQQLLNGQNPYHLMADETDDVARLVNSTTKPSDYILSLDQPVLYFLTHTQVPTHYLHPLYFVSPECIKFVGLSPQKELENIEKTRPVYVIFNRGLMQDYQAADQGFLPGLERWIRKDYTLIRIAKNREIYQRKNDL